MLCCISRHRCKLWNIIIIILLILIKIQVIDEEKLQKNCEVVGTYFLEELAKLREEFEIIGDVRGKGLMIGVELVEDKVRKFYS